MHVSDGELVEGNHLTVVVTEVRFPAESVVLNARMAGEPSKTCSARMGPWTTTSWHLSGPPVTALSPMSILT
jgi:hypothetical protein